MSASVKGATLEKKADRSRLTNSFYRIRRMSRPTSEFFVAAEKKIIQFEVKYES